MSGLELLQLGRKIRYKLASVLFYKPQFKSFGKRSRIESALLIEGAKNIEIGKSVLVKSGTWLACLPQTTCASPVLSIGDDSVIGNFNHIYATQSVIIEKSVLTADKVYISDNLHSYEDVSLPIMRQAIKQTAAVVIGEGSWLGENVVVIGASVGKHCVIGANAVVNSDIPDYSVAVGVPAKVIKKYNFESQKWESINE